MNNEQEQKMEPLSEDEEKAWRTELNKVIWTWPVSYPAKFVQRIVLTLEAERTERLRLEAELERLTQFTAGCVAVGGKQITELEELRGKVAEEEKRQQRLLDDFGEAFRMLGEELGEEPTE